MKRLLVAMLSLVFVTSAFADDAKLRMKISGPVASKNRYFLCVSGNGCISMLHGSKGKAFPLNTGNVTRIFTVDASNMSYHMQPLPASCNVNIEGAKTLMVSGRLVQSSTGHVQIQNMRCSVSG